MYAMPFYAPTANASAEMKNTALHNAIGNNTERDQQGGAQR
jgi:hypothetical protein